MTPLASSEPVEKQTEAAETIRGLVAELVDSPENERNRLLQILDMIPNYVVLLGEDRRILYHNRAFANFFGAVGQNTHCYEIMRDEASPCQFCPPLDSILSGSSSVTEWVSPKNFAYRVYSYPFSDLSGKKMVLKVGMSVTASVRMRQALDLSESSYRVITDNLAIGIAILSRELVISAGNVRLSQWFGARFTNGQRLCEVLHCNGDAPLPCEGEFCPDCPFARVMHDSSTHEKEFTIPLHGARERTMRLVACPVSLRQGNPRALVMMLEDITKRLALNRQLQRVRNLEAMGTLAGGIAHEINQPLSALSLYASGMQMMLEKSGEVDSEIISERFDLILKESEKIRGIISTMRSLVAKGGEVELCPVSVKATLETVLGIMDHQFTARNIDIVVTIPDTLPLVLSHPMQLEQMFINLISNAVHAIDAVPQEVLLARSHKKHRIVFNATGLDGGKRVRIAIGDSGTGLPPDRERIFDPFFTTKDASKGMGLGLSIVGRLVSQWGGEITVKTKDPIVGGATFFITLAVASEGEQKEPQEEPKDGRGEGAEEA